MHKSLLLRRALLLAFLFVALPIVREAPAEAPPAANAAKAEPKEKGGLVTLYALDPIANTFSFGKGKYGHVIDSRRVLNGESDIDFNSYNAGGFTVGIEGSRLATIIDLGSAKDLPKKYGYSETVGGGQGFASIHKQAGKVLIRNEGKGAEFQPIQESGELFRKGKANASTPVNLGHIYLIRISDDKDNAFERVVKMLVVAYKADESVTIRWEMLE